MHFMVLHLVVIDHALCHTDIGCLNLAVVAVESLNCHDCHGMFLNKFHNPTSKILAAAAMLRKSWTARDDNGSDSLMTNSSAG